MNDEGIPCGSSRAGTNYIGLENQTDLETAIRFASEFWEVSPGQITEHEVMEAFDEIERRRDLAAAQELINGNDPDETET